MKIQYLLYVILCMFMATSCKKENELSAYEQLWPKLKEPENSDQQAVFTQLQGEWRMIATACSYCKSPGVKAVNKNVKLVFTADSTVNVFENGQLIRSSKFTLTPYSAYVQTYSVETIPMLHNLYTWGYVSFYADKVGFISSDTDGTDYFFQRIAISKEE